MITGRVARFDRSIDHEDQYSHSRVWIGMFLNGMAGLPGIPMPGESVSSQLAADIRLVFISRKGL